MASASASSHGIRRLGVRLGASFAPWRAASLGLEWRAAFSDLLALGLAPIRLSASWRTIEEEGFDALDEMLTACERTGTPVVLTVGMKAQGWPEFYLPAAEPVPIACGADIAQVAAVRGKCLRFVSRVVERYRDRRAVVAWQVENEPFNRSGPLLWWINSAFVRREIRAVRALDRRPVIVNTFAHFNPTIDDYASRHHGRRRRPWHLPAEREALAVLGRGDVLGLDVYRAIGRRDGEVTWVQRADGEQMAALVRWRRIADAQQKATWITEAQAEPWEAPGGSMSEPRTVAPADLAETRGQLARAGFGTILLWGSEYWLWRSANGDSRWIDAVVA